MRYRFAVLDGAAAADDTHRRRADPAPAIRHEVCRALLSVAADSRSFPANLADCRDYPIPPSGHVLGIYARTDIERGVHKAPANEVVRGITGLQRKLNKEQQDILNPYPVNINVIRDFRDNNRGIRVYGGAGHHQRPGLEVRQRPPAVDLHRGVHRPRAAVGGVRAQRRAPVGAGAPLDLQLPDPGLAQRRLEGTKAEEAFFVNATARR